MVGEDDRDICVECITWRKRDIGCIGHSLDWVKNSGVCFCLDTISRIGRHFSEKLLIVAVLRKHNSL